MFEVFLDATFFFYDRCCGKIKWSIEKKENFSGIDIKADFILFKSDHNEYGASGFRVKQQGR